MFHAYLPVILRVRPDRAGVTPPLGERFPASFGPLCRISSIVQSRRLSRGVLRPLSGGQFRTQSAGESGLQSRVQSDRLFGNLYPAQQ